MGKLNTRSYLWTCHSAVALTTFADVWPRATETEIGAALYAIGVGRALTLDSDVPQETWASLFLNHNCLIWVVVFFGNIKKRPG